MSKNRDLIESWFIDGNLFQNIYLLCLIYANEIDNS